MKFQFVEEKLTYDGSQLRSLFAYLQYGVLGDSIMSWVGPCNIPDDKIVDGEDLLAGSEIRGGEMLHFIIEKFRVELFSGVCLQRLMASLVKETLLGKGVVTPQQISRRGDDVYINDGKLNISIATQSPTSTLIHFAINVSNEGTPVKTSCLNELGVEARAFSEELAEKMIAEVSSIEKATMKVRWVK